MKRRSLFLGGAGAAAIGALALRPSAPAESKHSAYFNSLSAMLREQGIARPAMIVDLDRLDHNIDQTVSGISPARDFRVVAKSIPSKPLIEYCLKRAKTERLMVFHQPFLNKIARDQPNANVLMGKPMPVLAAKTFYQKHVVNGFDVEKQLQWLIDTPERLNQYRQLAEQLQLSMQVNIELDVGLHRGGVQEPEILAKMLSMIADSPNLELGGLMGYDPHVAKVPTVLGMQGREFNASVERYKAFRDIVNASRLGYPEEQIFNAAGSPTYGYWQGVDGVANELAAGSALVKAMDFDIPPLEQHIPAVYIATPVLKASNKNQMPVLPFVGPMQKLWNPNRARSFFVYGGYWKAKPMSPPGLIQNDFYGRSTNQEMLNGGAKTRLNVDDFVFYRPTQSEFVMLQFGDLLAVRGGKLQAMWPVLDQAGS